MIDASPLPMLWRQHKDFLSKPAVKLMRCMSLLGHAGASRGLLKRLERDSGTLEELRSRSLNHDVTGSGNGPFQLHREMQHTVYEDMRHDTEAFGCVISHLLEVLTGDLNSGWFDLDYSFSEDVDNHLEHFLPKIPADMSILQREVCRAKIIYALYQFYFRGNSKGRGLLESELDKWSRDSFERAACKNALATVLKSGEQSIKLVNETLRILHQRQINNATDEHDRGLRIRAVGWRYICNRAAPMSGSDVELLEKSSDDETLSNRSRFTACSALAWHYARIQSPDKSNQAIDKAICIINNQSAEGSAALSVWGKTVLLNLKADSALKAGDLKTGFREADASLQLLEATFGPEYFRCAFPIEICCECAMRMLQNSSIRQKSWILHLKRRQNMSQHALGCLESGSFNWQSLLQKLRQAHDLNQGRESYQAVNELKEARCLRLSGKPEEAQQVLEHCRPKLWKERRSRFCLEFALTFYDLTRSAESAKLLRTIEKDELHVSELLEMDKLEHQLGGGMGGSGSGIGSSCGDSGGNESADADNGDVAGSPRFSEAQNHWQHYAGYNIILGACLGAFLFFASRRRTSPEAPRCVSRPQSRTKTSLALLLLAIVLLKGVVSVFKSLYEVLLRRGLMTHPGHDEVFGEVMPKPVLRALVSLACFAMTGILMRKMVCFRTGARGSGKCLVILSYRFRHISWIAVRSSTRRSRRSVRHASVLSSKPLRPASARLCIHMTQNCC